MYTVFLFGLSIYSVKEQVAFLAQHLATMAELGYGYRQYVYIYISKISNEVGRTDNFRALARKLSFLPIELDIFDIRQHYIRILFILQRMIC